jgi:hypothetical protein
MTEKKEETRICYMETEARMCFKPGYVIGMGNEFSSVRRNHGHQRKAWFHLVINEGERIDMGTETSSPIELFRDVGPLRSSF